MLSVFRFEPEVDQNGDPVYPKIEYSTGAVRCADHFDYFPLEKSWLNTIFIAILLHSRAS